VADSHWGTTPRRSIEVECERRGRDDVVDGCRRLLRGEPVDPALLTALAGPASAPFLGGQPRDDDYWLRLWGARGLLWQWDPAALPEIGTALGDNHWRVREMGLLVVKRHRLDALLESVEALQHDPVPRVRTAAAKALVTLSAG